MIKAILYDLDNTLYPVPAIGEKLFAPVFKAIEESGKHAHNIANIKREMMRTPFRLVAKKYGMSDALTEKCIKIQETLTYDEPIPTFDDYREILKLPADRYLVTTGFFKMQQSKIDAMGIRNDFKEIHIVDPTQSSKKEVFSDILARNSYKASEALVVGDDPKSEIKAAKELGIATVLYDREKTWPAGTADYQIQSFLEMAAIVSNIPKT